VNLTKALILLSIIVFATVSCQGTSDVQLGLEKPGAMGKGISGVKKQDYREGEILVKLRSGVNKPAIEKLIKGLDLEIVKVISAPNLYLLRIPRDSTVPEIIERPKQFEEVEYSEPNYIRYIQ